MRSRCAMAWMLALGVWGCQPHSKPVEKVQPVTRPSTQATTEPTTREANVASAEALAFRTKEYARRMEYLARRRAATQATTAPIASTQASTQPSLAHPVTQPTRAIRTPSQADLLERQIQQRVRDNPNDLTAQLDYQLLLMLRGAEVPEMASLSPLTSEDRDTVAALMDCIAKLRGAGSSDAMINKKIQPIMELADRLRTRAELAVPSVVLCENVAGFGVYAPLSSSVHAGQETPAVVYCEVSNFASALDDHHEWLTKFTQSMTLYNDKGQSVWQDNPRPVIDRAHSKRRDFFLARVVRFPKTLEAGAYTLKVTITDQQSQRIAEGVTSLTVQ